MKTLCLALMALVLLTACASEPVARCQPSPALLAPAESLPQLEEREYSLEGILTLWANDMRRYGDLKADKDALAEWVRERC